MTGRQRLPDRRSNTSVEIEWGGNRWGVTVGWDQAGKVREIFLKGAKEGSDLDVGAEDACFIVSRLLQRGESIADLSKSLLLYRPLPADDMCDTGAVRPSLIAVAVAVAARIEEEDGPSMACLEQALTPDTSNPRLIEFDPNRGNNGHEDPDDQQRPGASVGAS